MPIILGEFILTRKRYTENHQKNSFILIFEDENDNKLTLDVDPKTFEKYDIGDPLDLRTLLIQSKITEHTKETEENA